MMLERGNKDKPTGNLIIYTHVRGENPFKAGSKILASNVYISFVTTSDALPVVTFPPVPYRDKRSFLSFLRKHPGFDLIRMDDFVFPDDPGEGDDYMKSRIDDFNQLVNQYVELCTNFLQEQELLEGLTDSEGETLEFRLEGVEVETATRKETDQPPSETERFPGEDTLAEIRFLEKEAGQLREKITEASEPTPEETPDNQSLLPDGVRGELARFREYSNDFTTRHPEYDLQNLNRYISHPHRKAGEITELFFRKFRAIYFENYEEAGTLNRRIQKIAAQIP